MKTPTPSTPFINAKIQLVVGIAAAVAVFLTAVQTGDFQMIREKTQLLKSFTLWKK